MRAALLACCPWLGLALLGCSLLVGGEPTPMHCSQRGIQGPPACDPGLECRGGICQAPQAAADGGAGASPDSAVGAGASAGGAR